ncbi:type II and III secretion system protein family protein [Sphingosinithalassobacter sp. CS137]|uniref:type II and III secretion system protein family protein n=1 Tax=Sphingosinithalassobacter sp. CS137 TaxID=2762748 RepID=UPI0021D10869|nr:type II and III secretion system protein family protein [Sphingosinithalassobacter sp. CS137]
MRFLAKPMVLPFAAVLATGGAAALSVAPAAAQTTAPSPTNLVQISTGGGRLVTLDAPMTDVFVANAEVADVQVRSPTQLYVFGKAPGETTVYATSRGGGVVYAATVRIANNIDSIDSMLRLAMPEAQIVATPMNGLILLTGTIASPDDAAEAERLVQAFVGEETQIISRLRTATPLQVNLQVRFAEVSRSFVKNVGANLLTRDTTNGFQFGIGSGRSPGTIGSVDTSNLPQLDASARFGLPAGSIELPFDPRIGDFVYPDTGTQFDWSKGPQQATLALAGRLFGLDILSAIDLGETIGQVTTLAQPNLTALSGETGTFLAGGEIPIPIAQGLGAVSIEYKQYGISLAFTPTVLADGRLSLRVRPEVSQLNYAQAVQFEGTILPSVSTRRAETTVELGSGESFMIAGLLSNTHDNSIDKAPGLGDLPILGTLFRSNAFQRNETELVIVITATLVRPVTSNQISLPTDGYQAPDDFSRILGGQLSRSTDAPPPRPSMAPAPAAAPALGAAAPVQPQPQASEPAPQPRREQRRSDGSAAPGFSLD